MQSPADAIERASDLVDRARRAGADACDVAVFGSASESIQVRLGALEDVERSESEDISLRVFVGKRSASIGSTDFSPEALDELAERAVAMASAAPEDAYAGLAPEELLFTGTPPNLDLEDPDDPAPQDLRDAAQEAEDCARAVAGITNSEGAGASAGRSVVALATSDGFAGCYATSSHSLGATVLAGEGSGMQRDYDWRQARYREDLPSPQEIGQRAAKRTVAKLDPGNVASGPMPVVFDPRAANSLLGHLVSAMSGPSIARRASFLLGREDENLFDPSVVITDDPHRTRGLRSRPFDGEGLPTAKRNLVEYGRITGWLLNAASARQLDLVPNGHASRGASGAPGVSATNVHLPAGPVSPGDLMSDIEQAVSVPELIGMGVNAVTGDYSRGASGFRIENGEFAGPIAEFTVAGNLLSMFANLIPANDLEWYRAINAPTIRIDGMTVAGE